MYPQMAKKANEYMNSIHVHFKTVHMRSHCWWSEQVPPDMPLFSTMLLLILLIGTWTNCSVPVARYIAIHFLFGSVKPTFGCILDPCQSCHRYVQLLYCYWYVSCRIKHCWFVHGVLFGWPSGLRSQLSVSPVSSVLSHLTKKKSLLFVTMIEMLKQIVQILNLIWFN